MRYRHRRNQKRLKSHCDGEVPLISLCEGESCIVTHATGGFGVVRRLAEMGLTPGVEIRLLRKCPFRGPVAIEVRGAALALGCGVASKIFVTPLKAQLDG